MHYIRYLYMLNITPSIAGTYRNFPTEFLKVQAQERYNRPLGLLGRHHLGLLGRSMMVVGATHQVFA